MSARIIPFPPHRIVRVSPTAKLAAELLAMFAGVPSPLKPKPKRPKRR